MPTSTRALVRAAIALALREAIDHHIKQAAAASAAEREEHMARVAALQKMMDRGEMMAATRH